MRLCAGMSGMTVKVYDFDTDAELTTFTAELP